MPIPIRPERRALGSCDTNSFMVKPKPLMPRMLGWVTTSSLFCRLVSAAAMISPTAKRPTITASMSKPLFKLVEPKVKRWVDSMASVPMVENMKPRTPAAMPLTMLPLDRVAIMVKEKMAMEKNS